MAGTLVANGHKHRLLNPLRGRNGLWGPPTTLPGNAWQYPANQTPAIQPPTNNHNPAWQPPHDVRSKAVELLAPALAPPATGMPRPETNLGNIPRSHRQRAGTTTRICDHDTDILPCRRRPNRRDLVNHFLHCRHTDPMTASPSVNGLRRNDQRLTPETRSPIDVTRPNTNKPEAVANAGSQTAPGLTMEKDATVEEELPLLPGRESSQAPVKLKASDSIAVQPPVSSRRSPSDSEPTSTPAAKPNANAANRLTEKDESLWRTWNDSFAAEESTNDLAGPSVEPNEADVRADERNLESAARDAWSHVESGTNKTSSSGNLKAIDSDALQELRRLNDANVTDLEDAGMEDRSVEDESSAPSGRVAMAPSRKDAQPQQDASESRELQLVPDVNPAPYGYDWTGRAKSHAGSGALPQIPSSVARLRSPISQTLRYYHQNAERADGRSNWGMMHAIMVYRGDTRIIARGRQYNAVAWLAGNNVCRGKRLMTTDKGKLQVREGVGLQGHQAQFLAVMAMAGVPSNYPLYVGRQRFDIEDLVKAEAAACRDDAELTFTLIGLSYYLDTETTWVGEGKQAWDFQRLIASELDQPVVGAACGGTHRLMSFAHALRKRRLEGNPVEGQWLRAERYLDDFVDYTYRLQNRDGSMSTQWFEGPEDNGDLDRKVQTTGHMTEFLLTHLPDEKLNDPRLQRSVTFLLNSMSQNTDREWSIGPKGHALRSLSLYQKRIFNVEPVTTSRPSTANRRTSRR